MYLYAAGVVLSSGNAAEIFSFDGADDQRGRGRACATAGTESPSRGP